MASVVPHTRHHTPHITSTTASECHTLFWYLVSAKATYSGLWTFSLYSRRPHTPTGRNASRGLIYKTSQWNIFWHSPLGYLGFFRCILRLSILFLLLRQTHAHTYTHFYRLAYASGRNFLWLAYLAPCVNWIWAITLVHTFTHCLHTSAVIYRITKRTANICVHAMVW